MHLLIRHSQCQDKSCCRNKHCLSFALAMVLLLPGCADITGVRSPIPPDNAKPHPEKKYPVPGHVYTMRGFLGIFSRGMDGLSDRCTKELHMSSMSVAALEWPKLAKYIINERNNGNLKGPLILVGHSEGADDQIEVAKKLQKENIDVDMLVLVGPFAPNPVPSNVKKVVNLDRSYLIGKVVPFMGNVTVKIADPIKTKMESLDLGYANVNFNTLNINHFNIDKSQDVQNMILTKIKKYVETPA